MSEQEENELLCEKLLGWVRLKYQPNLTIGVRWMRGNDNPMSHEVLRTPSFRSVADAALILEVLRMRGTVHIELDVHFADVRFQQIRSVEFELPLAVRAAALEYIRSQS